MQLKVSIYDKWLYLILVLILFGVDSTDEQYIIIKSDDLLTPSEIKKRMDASSGKRLYITQRTIERTIEFHKFQISNCAAKSNKMIGQQLRHRYEITRIYMIQIARPKMIGQQLRHR